MTVWMFRGSTLLSENRPAPISLSTYFFFRRTRGRLYLGADWEYFLAVFLSYLMAVYFLSMSLEKPFGLR